MGIFTLTQLKRYKVVNWTRRWEYNMFKPEGIFPALVTPFTDDGKTVDEERLRVLVNKCIELGVHGVVPCGTTGEFVNLTKEEKKQVIKTVINEVNGRVPVIAGT